ncbi:MAG: uracil-DNA glycosylase [Nitrospinae bacterium]|nr:uracil-DNA glycosylase [Nitrospinota bacterium]
MVEPKSKEPNCFECAHHHITWDAKFPYGCKAIGFKSRVMPSAEVRQNSGESCLAFTPSKKARVSDL